VKRNLCILLLPLAGAALPAAASEPLYAKNLSPVTGLFGLPSQRDAFTTAPRAFAASLHSSIASHYINDANSKEFVNIDGETLRFALELRYGLAENWDLQVEIPWLDQSGGDLDEFIDDWHDFWGFSDGGRSDVDSDLLNYTYANIDGEGFSFGDDSSGIGDVSLSISHSFYRDEGAAFSAFAGWKFGTGDEDDFTGSGEDDWFLGLRFSGAHLSDLPLSWHGHAGYLRAGESDLLDDLQEKNLWFAGLAMDWHITPRWSLIAQIDSNEGPLDSDLTATGDEAFMATLGGRWRFAEHWALDFSVIEDIRVESAPDVTFQASIRYRHWPQD
jgi:hypothetical protein